ncbi:MAG: hypothetical protein JWM39_852 [Parcubacteria group bacterium]|nr:hypothetical protein [Parcubacteria group bacterium]
MPADQSTVSPPSYQLPPVPPAPPHRGRTITLIVVGALIVLLAIVAGLYYFTPLGTQLMTMFVPTSIPTELKSASFLSDTPTGNTIVYQGTDSIKTPKDAGTVIVSAVENASGGARITRSADGTFKVLLDNTVVIQDTKQRIGIDRSPDGKSVVFAQASSTIPFIPPAISPTLHIDRKGWNVLVYVPASHTTINLGTGVSPFFIDTTHVAWLAPAGLAVADLSTGQSKILVPDTTGRASAATLVSPDHSVFAWYQGATKTMMPYKVTATAAMALPKTLIPDSLRWVALGNDSFYELQPVASETEILKQPFGASATVVGRLPLSAAITRLWLGSI